MNNQKTFKLSKNIRGQWQAKSTEIVNGVTWKITTMKRYNGFISSIAQQCQISEDGTLTSFTMYQDKCIELVKEKSRATEGTIRTMHYKALVAFDTNETVLNTFQSYEVKPGQIVYLDNLHSKSHMVKKVIFEVDESKFTKGFKAINTETLKINHIHKPEPFSKRFGIGHYYNEGEVMEADELANLVIEAKRQELKESQIEEANKLLAQAERESKIEEGKKLISIPSWAKSVIVADHYVNESDSMTDYFATSVSDTVYLAFSKSTRNNMNELKKSACQFEHTKDFASDSTYENQDGGYYTPGYYVGEDSWSGWKVNKRKYFDLSKEANRELLYIAAADGKYLIGQGDQKQKSEQDKPNLELVDYSDKAFAIIGDTKAIKDELKKMGGKFNFRLKCGAGWIFSKTRQSEVIKALNL